MQIRDTRNHVFFLHTSTGCILQKHKNCIVTIMFQGHEKVTYQQNQVSFLSQ